MSEAAVMVIDLEGSVLAYEVTSATQKPDCYASTSPKAPAYACCRR